MCSPFHYIWNHFPPPTLKLFGIPTEKGRLTTSTLEQVNTLRVLIARLTRDCCYFVTSFCVSTSHSAECFDVPNLNRKSGCKQSSRARETVTADKCLTALLLGRLLYLFKRYKRFRELKCYTY